MRGLAIILGATLALAGCTAVPGSSPTPVPSPSPPPAATATPQPTPAPGGSPMVEIEVPEDILQPIIQEVAVEAGVAPDQVAIERAEQVTWRDGSLGCPEPGMMYIQVLIDGYWVVLRVGDQTYDIRIDNQGQFRLCPEGMGQPPLEGE